MALVSNSVQVTDQQATPIVKVNPLEKGGVVRIATGFLDCIKDQHVNYADGFGPAWDLRLSRDELTEHEQRLVKEGTLPDDEKGDDLDEAQIARLREDVARLDGYLKARAEADAPNRAERRRRTKKRKKHGRPS